MSYSFAFYDRLAAKTQKKQRRVEKLHFTNSTNYYIIVICTENQQKIKQQMPRQKCLNSGLS